MKTNKPTRVFFAERPTSWLRSVPRLAKEFVTPGVIAHLQSQRPGNLASDDLDWLDAAVYRTIRRCLEIQDLFLERFRAEFAFFRAYHGCRIEKATSYRNVGLLPLAKEDAVARARLLFMNDRFPEITPEVFDAAAAAARQFHQSPSVWFCSNKRDLQFDCSHYVLYGSEQIMAIAAAIQGGTRFDYRQALKLYGTPTIVVCNVPVNEIPYGFLKCYTNSVLVAWISMAVQGQLDYDSRGGFNIGGSLSPELIVRIEHPTKVGDPFRRDDRHYLRAPWQRN